jgi:hypothetical protein
MKSPKPPAAPDPKAVAAAQTGMNVDTAIAQQLINMTGQNTPEGSLSYDQSGFTSFTGSDGKTYQIPKFTANQTYSPGQQELYDIGMGTQKNLAQMGQDQSAKIAQLLSTPLDINNEDTEARLYELGSKRLDPQFARDEEALRTRLVNQGVREGSDAWNNAMKNFDYSRNDARNDLLLRGRGQAVQEQLTERNQPLNEVTALMSGSQVSQPNFTGTPQSGVQGTDYAGMVRDKYAADMAAYQQKAQQQQAAMGGLFGLLGKAPQVAAGFF